MQKTLKNSWVYTSIHGERLQFNGVTGSILSEQQGVNQVPAKKECMQQMYCHNRKPEKLLSGISLTTNVPFSPV